MPVFATFSRWRAARARRRTLVVSAIREFETAGRRAIRGMCSIIGEEARGTVVRVCYGDTRPPRRAWFVIGPDGSVAELPWAEAQRLDMCAWR